MNPEEGLHILLVDDEEDVLSVTASCLEQRGFIVTSKSDGLSALKTFAENPDGFDICVLDEVMPGLSGGELAAMLRRLRPDLPVLLYSGYIDAATTRRMRADKIRVFFKPLSGQELESAIRKTVKGGLRKPGSYKGSSASPSLG